MKQKFSPEAVAKLQQLQEQLKATPLVVCCECCGSSYTNPVHHAYTEAIRGLVNANSFVEHIRFERVGHKLREVYHRYFLDGKKMLAISRTYVLAVNAEGEYVITATAEGTVVSSEAIEAMTALEFKLTLTAAQTCMC